LDRVFLNDNNHSGWISGRNPIANPCNDQMLGCLQSLPGFAEVFYRWDSLLGGLFVAGLAGAIQYMHSRFLEPKSGKQKHFEMVFFGTGNVGL